MHGLPADQLYDDNMVSSIQHSLWEIFTISVKAAPSADKKDVSRQNQNQNQTSPFGSNFPATKIPNVKLTRTAKESAIAPIASLGAGK